MPWVRQKVGGHAPPDVCRWLVRVVSRHEAPAVVLAAEQALLDLVAESKSVSCNADDA